VTLVAERYTAFHSTSVTTASMGAAQFRGKAIMTPDPFSCSTWLATDF
jgi:hypothetical protein